MDEFEAVGLTPVPALHGVAPRILEAALSVECSLMQVVDVGDGRYGSTTLVLGELLHAYVDENCLEGGNIRPGSLGTVSRLGGMDFGGADVQFTVRKDRVWSEKHW